MPKTFPCNFQRGCALPHIGGALGAFVCVHVMAEKIMI